MLRFRSTTLLAFSLGFGLLFFALTGVVVYAQESKAAQKSNGSPAESSAQASEQPSANDATPIVSTAQRMSKQTRYEIIRDFETQLVYARTSFPMGTKGLQLKAGVITPNGEELREALSLWGPAIKPGDPAHISLVQIKDDHIHFEINGGPIHRKKWYQHIEVGGQNGSVPIAADNPQNNPHGTYLDVYFTKYVPEMTPQQLRKVLFPALDFTAANKEQAYLDTVPPIVKAAIQQHRVLVGMNQEMVLHAKGKPPKKVRERDGATEYEEWIYGEPPADVDFVRVVGDEVVRVETMKVDGEKIVRTNKEVVLPDRDKEKEAKEAKKETERPAGAPSLRRPGETSDDVPKPTGAAPDVPRIPASDAPQAANGPGEIVQSR